MNKELVGRFAAAVGALSIVLTLAACESAEDIAAKPDLVAIMKQSAIEMCDPQYGPADMQSYGDRLDGVLMQTDTQALRYLQEHNITICLDKRLPEVKTGFFESAPLGIFYPSETQPILTLRDNGTHIKDQGFFSLSGVSRTPQAIEKFSNAFTDFWGTPISTPASATGAMFARTASCGKSCTTVRWDDYADFAGHMEVSTPPVLPQFTP